MSTLQSILQRGTAVSQPAANTVPVGTLYFQTDTFFLQRSNGSTWDSYGPVLLVGDSGSGGTRGLVPAPASGDAAAGKFLKADATWAVPSGGGGSITSGSFASLPGTCSVGDVYFFTDSYYTHCLCKSSNVWTPFIGGLVAGFPGIVSGWTTVNGASNFSATDVNGAVQIQINNNASLNWRLLTKSQPSTPYTFTFIWALYQQISSSQTSGVYFYDGTKLMGLEILTQSAVFTIRVEKITNVTTDSSTVASKALFNSSNIPLQMSPFGTLSPLGSLMYGRITNSGTTLTFQYSFDGITWTTLFSESVGTFITPTKYGFGGVNNMSTSSVIIQNMLSIVQS